jgi:hypothetical protein
MHGNAELSASIEFRGNDSRWHAAVDVGLGACIVYAVASAGGWTGIVGGVFVGGLFLLSAFGKAFGELDRTVHLAFDADGLSAPHILERKVPWTAIQAYSVNYGAASEGSMFVQVVEPKLYGARITGPLETWPVTPTGFNLVIHGLDCDDADIEAAFRRFSPGIPRI